MAAVNGAQFNAGEAAHGVVVDVVLEKHPVPDGLPVVQHVKHILHAIGIDAKGLDPARSHDENRVDGVSLVHQDVAAPAGGAHGAGEQVALRVIRQARKQANPVDAGAVCRLEATVLTLLAGYVVCACQPVSLSLIGELEACEGEARAHHAGDKCVFA